MDTTKSTAAASSKAVPKKVSRFVYLSAVVLLLFHYLGNTVFNHAKMKFACVLIACNNVLVILPRTQKLMNLRVHNL